MRISKRGDRHANSHRLPGVLQTARRGGFTLVEMLVAVTASLFILAIFSYLVVAATQSIRTAKGLASIQGKVRSVVVTMRQDLNDVYVGREGNRIALRDIFTDASLIPTEGYFSIEENDRALEQGIDDYGNPIVIDYDDVLAMTCRRSGTGPDSVYSGVCSRTGNATPTAFDGNGDIQNLGIYLDDLLDGDAPQRRWDTVNDGRFTSRSAEIVYFLRPDDRQYNLTQIGADPNNINPSQREARPATFTLYRRQLLVLENTQELNVGGSLTPGGNGLQESTIATTAPFWQLYDVSASRELAVNGAGDNYEYQDLVHFNSLRDLSRREFRYGFTAIDTQRIDPRTDADTAMTGTAGERPVIAAVPLSHTWSNSVANNLTVYPVHDYFRWLSPGQAPEAWFGRLTLAECCFANARNQILYPTGADIRQVAALQNAVVLDANSDGIVDACAYDRFSPASVPARAEEDVILTDVISMDIKVLEDIGGFPEAPPVVNQILGHNLDGAYAPSSSPPPGYTTYPVIPNDDRVPGFVDLGFLSDRDSFTNNSGIAQDILTFGYSYPGSKPLYYDQFVYNQNFARFGIPFHPEDDASWARLEFGWNDIDDTTAGTTYNDDYTSGTPATILTQRSYNFFGTDYDPYTVPAQRFSGYGIRGPDGNPTDNVGYEGHLYPATALDDLPPYVLAPFGRSGVVGFATDPASPPDLSTIGHPRNTYDTWSDDYPANPAFEDTTGATDFNAAWQPVPYPRPLKAIQITIRVWDERSNIARDVTFRHSF